MSPATIRLIDLKLVFATAKARRLLNSELGWFCALSEHPVIQLDCAGCTRIRKEMLEDARRYGWSKARMQPMQRGHIGKLIERTRWKHGSRGLAEVRATWGVGIRALLAESRYSLQGSKA